MADNSLPDEVNEVAEVNKYVGCNNWESVRSVGRRYEYDIRPKWPPTAPPFRIPLQGSLSINQDIDIFFFSSKSCDVSRK